MRKLTAGAVLVAGVLGGAAATAVVSPGLAAQVTGTTPAAVTDRVDTIKDALSGLVDDGTLTRDQADEVAETLGDADVPFRGPHGHRGSHAAHLPPATVAGILGITVEELRTATQDGKTLAQVAEAEGISKADLVADLVSAAEKQVAAAVEAGDLTQAQADEITADLEARITEGVDRVGRHGGPGGRGHHGGFGGSGRGEDGPGRPPAAPVAERLPEQRDLTQRVSAEPAVDTTSLQDQHEE